MFSIGIETYKYPGAQEYTQPSARSSGRSVLYSRICKCCISKWWSGFIQGKAEWVSWWNSPFQDTVWYGLRSEAMARSIAKVQLSVSVTLYLYPGSPLTMNSVDFIKTYETKIQQQFDKAQQLVWQEKQSALHLEDLWEAVAAACLAPLWAEIDVHMANLIRRNLKATKHLPSMSWPCSNLE